MIEPSCKYRGPVARRGWGRASVDLLHNPISKTIGDGTFEVVSECRIEFFELKGCPLTGFARENMVLTFLAQRMAPGYLFLDQITCVRVHDTTPRLMVKAARKRALPRWTLDFTVPTEQASI